MPLQLCKEHVTFVAFTADWCHNCVAMKPELVKLKQKANENNCHFFWFDVGDAANKQLFQDFNIPGFPTLLRYNPQAKKWTKYEGERTAEAILKCAAKNECNDKEWTNAPALKPISHSKVHDETSSGEMMEKSNDDDDDKHDSKHNDDTNLELCNQHPTLLAFTGLSWCPHCVDAQDGLDSLKKASQKSGKFHVQQFDSVYGGDLSDTSKKLLEEHNMTQDKKQQERAHTLTEKFHIQGFPTFLVYEPQKKFFVRVDNLEKLEDAMTNDDTLNTLREKVTNDMFWQNVPKDNIRIVKHTNDNNMKGDMPAMVVLVDANASLAQHQQPPPSHVLSFCATCPTIIAFTGQWCRPYNAMAEEIELLRTHQGCGKFHFEQVKYTPNVQNDQNTITDAFGVDSWPTLLIFDPYRRQFGHYRGPRKAQAMASCNFANLPQWPAPRGIRVNLIQKITPQQQHQPEVVPESCQKPHTQVPGRVKLCAYCPTVLFFALDKNTFEHNESQQAEETDIHALHFCNAKEHAQAFDMFQMRQFPTILVYCPRMNLFFKYSGDKTDLESIKQAYHTHGGLTTPWTTHPRVDLIR